MDVQLPIEAKDIQKLIPHRYPFLQLAASPPSSR
ncbi:(3R)-hydroxymyristoyl-ACP dehydratase [Neisseria meningitidis]|nr:(3R)-hydroxymyristoyl-ACP dehydratase [Neisseria meningitidis]CKJ93880.1 (3R)-hydroxymyristoyl-ACP dehydratase [Neisseria meningitidis]